jgi:hypothetical protein
LTAADFDRDGQPDFLSGGSQGGSLLLTSSNLADVPVLPDEMALTGFTNVTMNITNPLGYQASEQNQTIAGADVWRLDANSDDTLDEQIIDYNLLDGDYDLTFYLRPEFEGGGNQPLTSSVRIDGSQQVTLLDNYNFASASKGTGAVGCPTDSVTIRFNPNYVLNPAYISPSYGLQTASRQPKYSWANLVADRGVIDNYHIQFSTSLDFSTPIYEDSTLTQNFLCNSAVALDSGHVYYWRVRWHEDGLWSEYSNPLVAKIGGGCCNDDRRGDFNQDGNDANVLDLTKIVNYIFRFGSMPTCPEESDINADCVSNNILDLNYLVNFMFRLGPPPKDCPTCTVCAK